MKMVGKTIFSLVLLTLMGFATDISEPNKILLPDPEIGKQIYETGIGVSDQKILATVSGMDMDGSMMACANCHGKCGAGKVMQGVSIPDLRKSAYLSRYFDDREVSEKEMQKSLKKAITMGFNPKGDKLHTMMPRYKMSITDMGHLLAYLSVLGENDNCADK